MAAKRASAVSLLELQDARVMNEAANATVAARRRAGERMRDFPWMKTVASIRYLTLSASKAATGIRGPSGSRLARAPTIVYDLRSDAAPFERGSPMSSAPPCDWSGVSPAATTQFDSDLEVDLPATQRVQK